MHDDTSKQPDTEDKPIWSPPVAVDLTATDRGEGITACRPGSGDAFSCGAGSAGPLG